MHVSIEKARKASGIGSLKKNYPENPKERGCGFWAAFIGVISNELSERDARHMKDQETIATMAMENASLTERIGEIQTKRVANGIEAVGHMEGWSKDKQTTVMAKIAG
jgi:hypothetical protein